jgi:two-component system chemotaxis sensor kinase CheA
MVHTIKGDAAACGFRELSNASHELEDVLALESAPSDRILAEVAFTAADTFGAMLAAYRRKGKLPSSAPLAKMIREFSRQPKGKATKRATNKKAVKAAVAPAAWTEYEKLAIQNAVSRGTSVYHITAGIDPHCPMPIAARQRGLALFGEGLKGSPDAGAPANTQRLEVLKKKKKSADQLSALCRIPTVISSVVVEIVQAAEPKAKVAASPSANLHSPEPVEEHAGVTKPNHPVLAENILRVDAERIDSVLNLVGELIIGRSMLQQAFTEFARHVPKETLRGRFSDAMAFQSRVLSELQHSVMKIRMVPVVPALSPHGARCGQAMWQGSRAGDERSGDRSGQESARYHRRTDDPPGAQRGQSRHRERGRAGAKRKAGARNHPSHFVSSRQSGYRGNHRRRRRH